MTKKASAAAKRTRIVVVLVGVIIILALAGLALAFPDLIGDRSLPAFIGIMVALGLLAFAAWLLRDAYRAARATGLSRTRAVFRAIREAVDFFVTGT